jgi:hypothetical protein
MPVKLDAHLPGHIDEQPIVYTAIKALIGNYTTNLPTLPNGDADATSGWVSVSELLSLIADNNANGIRIYYSRHPSNDANYPYHHGIVLVSTFDSVNPQAPTTYNSTDLLNIDTESGPVNSVSFSGDGAYTGDGDDAIPLCPPACPQVHL